MDAGTRTSRRFREGWSLAAGWAPRPRVHLPAAIAAVALAVVTDTFVYGWLPEPLSELVWSARRARHTWLLPVAIVVAITIARAAREIRRLASERRRASLGGAAWWRDRVWPTQAMEQRIAIGLRGVFLLPAIAVAVTFALGSAGLAFGRPMVGLYSEPERWSWVRTGPAVVVFVFVVPLAWFLLVVVPRLGRGRLVVSWPQFPQFTGGRCAFHVGTSPGGARIDSVRVFLRCIRTPSRPFLPLANWNARLLWVGEARLPLGAYAGPQRHLVATFDVPADAPPTDLHAKDAVRWEVLVLGTVGGADYADSVIVPVYAS